MENVFNVNDYFSKNYGLGNKPFKPTLDIKKIFIHVLLCFLLIGFILVPIDIVSYINKKKKYEKWWDDYNTRRNTWDGELVKYYVNLVNSMNLKQVAMDKIGIDEDQITAAEPFSIYGQKYNGWYRRGADGQIRTDNREITWIFFSDSQIYLYTVTFSLTGSTKKTENTLEFFYSDITSVSTGSVSAPLSENKSLDDDNNESEYESEEFRLIVPGDKMYFAFTTEEGITRSIQAMKNLIRAKKIG